MSAGRVRRRSWLSILDALDILPSMNEGDSLMAINALIVPNI
jgi:hypothetical protein